MDNQQVQIFTSADGQAQLEVALVQDTVWLNQAQMAELFDKDVRTINEHIGNVFTDEELEREPTIRKFRIVRQEGKRQVQRDIEHYSLDVIISVGYRVKSPRGVQFRQWATRVLRQHLVEGYTLNQRRLAERGGGCRHLWLVVQPAYFLDFLPAAAGLVGGARQHFSAIDFHFESN